MVIHVPRKVEATAKTTIKVITVNVNPLTSHGHGDFEKWPNIFFFDVAWTPLRQRRC